MSNDNEEAKRHQEEERRRLEEAQRRQEEELRRIREEQERQKALDEELIKGRPTDERPDKDD